MEAQDLARLMLAGCFLLLFDTHTSRGCKILVACYWLSVDWCVIGAQEWVLCASALEHHQFDIRRIAAGCPFPIAA